MQKMIFEMDWKKITYVACLKESNTFIWNKKIIYFYNVSRLIIVSFFIKWSSRILNWSISFCRCMLSSKHWIVIILNLSNFIFPQFWPEIIKGSILNLAILSNKKIWKILYLIWLCLYDKTPMAQIVPTNKTITNASEDAFKFPKSPGGSPWLSIHRF